MTKKPPQRPSITPILPDADPGTARLMREMRQRIEVLEAQIAALKLYLADFLATHETATSSGDTEEDGAGDAER